MKILSWGNVGEGYCPGSIPLNQQEGYLEVGEAGPCQLQEASESFAETLILKCGLHPIPPREGTDVQLISEQKPLEPVFLYRKEAVIGPYAREIENSAYQGIAITYSGQGHGKRAGGDSFPIRGKIFQEGRLEVGDPLYIKPFRTETERLRFYLTTVGRGVTLASPPGVLDTYVLRGYGGYFKAGAPLETCEQVYYSLSSDYDKTRIRLHASSRLESQGIIPPQGGKTERQSMLFSPTPREEEYLSLKGALEAGYARVSVVTDAGRSTYVSSRVEETSSYPPFILLHFNLR